MAKVRKRTWQTKDGPKTAWLVDYKDAAGKRRFQTFDLKKDATAALVDIQGDLKQGTHTPTRDSITVAEAADIWIKHRRDTKKVERSTWQEYERHAKNYIVPALGGIRLAKLTTPVVDRFYTDLTARHSAAMCRKVMTSLKGILKRAQAAGYVGQNVATPVEVKADTRDKGKVKAGVDFPSKVEINAIIEHAEGRWRPFFITAVFTGMRASELRGLVWDDVDLDNNTITVRQRANLWGDIGSPKSASSHRDIRVPPMVVNALREWKLACPKGQLNLVFPNRRGEIEDHNNITRSGFNSIQRRAGMVDSKGAPKYGLHALRHFYASWIIERGFSPKRCQDLLGHSSMRMTYDTYGHLFPSPEDDDAKLAAGEAALLSVGGN